MHATLRSIMTKAPDLVAMSGVVQRMFGDNQPVLPNMRTKAHDVIRVTREMDPVSGDIILMSRNMVGMADNNAGVSHDMSAEACDLAFVPDDMEAMMENNATWSLVSLHRSLNPIVLLCGVAAMLRYEISEWYYRKMGLSDPVLRKFYQEAEFDDLFVMISMESDGLSQPRFHRRWEPAPSVVHELLYFLIDYKPLRRDPKMLLAVLLAYARLVLGLTERTAVRALPCLLAVQFGSGRSPLSPRPPPFATS